LVKSKDKDQEEEKQEQEKKKKKGSFTGNLILLLVAVILIILFLFGGAFVVAYRTGFIANILGNANTPQTTQVVVKEPTFTYEIPEIVVNLTDGDRRRFLSVKFYVGYEESKLTDELQRRMPEIRDAILQTLWGVTAEDASSAEGKERIRDEIQQSMNDLLNEGNIVGLYFWHMMIQ
jgi:flagellar FliL protein